MRIDGLQYANWSEKIFRQMRDGGVDAVMGGNWSRSYDQNFGQVPG